jgi:hypothetical protein
MNTGQTVADLTAIQNPGLGLKVMISEEKLEPSLEIVISSLSFYK